MRVLVVEDETLVADFIVRGLQAEQHMTFLARDGATALDLAQNEALDVIVLDLMLPGISGQEVCRRLRELGIATPILVLSALDGVHDRIAGLRMGADDYLTKPFDFSELVARIEAIARRPRTISSPQSCIEFGGIVFDREALEGQRGDAKIKLTVTELAILSLLLSTPGRVLSRERILSAVWGANADPLTNIVEVYIARLRKKLGDIAGDSYLETIRGAGYRMRAEK